MTKSGGHPFHHIPLVFNGFLAVLISSIQMRMQVANFFISCCDVGFRVPGFNCKVVEGTFGEFDVCVLRSCRKWRS